MALFGETDSTYRLYDSGAGAWNDYPKSTLGDWARYGLRAPTDAGGIGDFFDASSFGTTSSPNSGGGGGEEEGGFEFPTDLFPKSESQAGLPEWGNEWVKNYLDKFSPQIMSGLSSALTASENPVALNDAEKANLEYMSTQNIKPILSKMGSRGVLSSSVTSGAIADILAQLGSSAYDKAQTNQQNKTNNYMKAMAILESLLSTSRQSTSSQSNQWAPYSDLMQLMFLSE